MLDALLSASLLKPRSLIHWQSTSFNCRWSDFSPYLFLLPWNDAIRFSQLETKTRTSPLYYDKLHHYPCQQQKDYVTAHKNSSTSGDAQQDTALGDAWVCSGLKAILCHRRFWLVRKSLHTSTWPFPRWRNHHRIDWWEAKSARQAPKVSDKDYDWWKWFWCRDAPASLKVTAWERQLGKLLQALVDKRESNGFMNSWTAPRPWSTEIFVTLKWTMRCDKTVACVPDLRVLFPPASSLPIKYLSSGKSAATCSRVKYIPFWRHQNIILGDPIHFYWKSCAWPVPLYA